MNTSDPSTSPRPINEGPGPGTNSQDAAPRHIHRITIGGSGKSSDENRTRSRRKSNTPASEIVYTRTSATITRSSSRQRRLHATSESVGAVEAEHGRSDTAAANIPVTNGARSNPSQTTRGQADGRSASRLQRPKRYYPPNSWKAWLATEADPVANRRAIESDGRAPSTRLEDIPGSDHPSTTNRTTTVHAHSTSSHVNTSCKRTMTGPTTLSSHLIMENSFQSSSKAQPSRSEAALDQASNTSKPNTSTRPRYKSVYIRSRRRLSRTSFSSAPTPTPTSTGQLDGSNEQHSLSLSSISKAELPDPEVAYAHTYHFTTCPHKFPPVSRPLNVPPVLVEYHEGLLDYPPYLLRAFQNEQEDPMPEIYIIEGSCSHCDTSARREAESEVLNRYADDIIRLSDQVSRLRLDIESGDSLPESVPGSTSSHTTTDTLSSAKLPKLSIELSLNHIQAIVGLERQLNSLIKRREREVKSVWQGFTARWGPATLGIHHDPIQERGRPRRRSTSTESDTTGTMAADDGYTRSRSLSSDITSRMTSAPIHSCHSRTVSSVSRQQGSTHSRTTSISSSNGPQDRYSDGTRELVVSSSVDGVKSDGRMLVEWIRHDRSGGTRRAPSESHTREHG